MGLDINKSLRDLPKTWLDLHKVIFDLCQQSFLISTQTASACPLFQGIPFFQEVGFML